MCTRPFDKNIWSSFINSFFCARPFEQKLRCTLISFFICTRPFDEKLGSSLIHLFYLYTAIRPKIRVLIDLIFYLHTTIGPNYRVFFHLFFLQCTTVRPKIRFFINFFFICTSPKLRVTLTLKFILFLIVPIFCLQYCLNISSATIIPLYFVHYIHISAALIFRTLNPWLYEVLALLIVVCHMCLSCVAVKIVVFVDAVIRISN